MFLSDASESTVHYKRALCSLIQAFVHTRLDCCNSALAGVAEVYLWKLQSVQSVAAPVVSGACQCNHIPQFLKIHSGCLSINLVVFKTALMVWKCVRGAAPAYHSDLCIPATATSGQQHVRAATIGTLLVLCAWTAAKFQC